MLVDKGIVHSVTRSILRRTYLNWPHFENEEARRPVSAQNDRHCPSGHSLKSNSSISASIFWGPLKTGKCKKIHKYNVFEKRKGWSTVRGTTWRKMMAVWRTNEKVDWQSRETGRGVDLHLCAARGPFAPHPLRIIFRLKSCLLLSSPWTSCVTRTQFYLWALNAGRRDPCIVSFSFSHRAYPLEATLFGVPRPDRWNDSQGDQFLIFFSSSSKSLSKSKSTNHRSRYNLSF